MIYVMSWLRIVLLLIMLSTNLMDLRGTARSMKGQARSTSAFHKVNSRHVVVFEADMDAVQKQHCFHVAEKLRIAGNELSILMMKRYDQLIRTKRYRKLSQLYAQASKEGDSQCMKSLGSQMGEMRDQYGVIREACCHAMISIRQRLGLPSVLGLTRAEDVWRGMESLLFHGGKRLHLMPKGHFPIMRGKQAGSCIRIKCVSGQVVFHALGLVFTLIVKDRFQEEELARVLAFLSDPSIENDALAVYAETGRVLDTYRPCSVALKCQVIRGRMRVFIHLLVEGRAVAKKRVDGQPRHHLGVGRVGCDIGTRSVAFFSPNGCGLDNLGERGLSISQVLGIEGRIRRKLERSRRAMNPGNYDGDGKPMPGCLKWVLSKGYKADRTRLRDIQRKLAINRRLAQQEMANHLRSLGDVLITERPNANELHSRVGAGIHTKSIQMHSPGQFQQLCKEKFARTGGLYIEVPAMYKASQFDHTDGSYVKRSLSQRLLVLADGSCVQRDLYSAFLLACADADVKDIDRTACCDLFNSFKAMHDELLASLKEAGMKIHNSGF